MLYDQYVRPGNFTFERSSDYLAHFGIKGQKWGIRRYQNEDGSLTEEGKKRYLNLDGSYNNKGAHQLIQQIQASGDVGRRQILLSRMEKSDIQKIHKLQNDFFKIDKKLDSISPYDYKFDKDGNPTPIENKKKRAIWESFNKEYESIRKQLDDEIGKQAKKLTGDFYYKSNDRWNKDDTYGKYIERLIYTATS